MDRKTYRWCVVPQCKNNSKKNPEKMFVVLPFKLNIRRKWLQLARRKDANQISANSQIYFCEDHFDLPNDMENYMEYQIMGSVKRIKMRKGCMPSKFECQPDRKRRLPTSNIPSRLAAIKRQRRELVQEAECCDYVLTQKESAIQKSIDQTMQYPAQSSSKSDLQNIQKISIDQPSSEDKAVQAHVKCTYIRSKSTQTIIALRSTKTSPIRPSVASIALSPFKINKVPRGKPSKSGLTMIPKKIFVQEEKSDSDISTYSSNRTQSEQSSSVGSLQYKTPSNSSSLDEEFVNIQKQHYAELTIKVTNWKIDKNPRFYIGIPKESLFLIDLLSECTNKSKDNIMLCLKKIRLNTKFTELGDDYGISTSYASKIFLNNIPTIAYYLKPFIIKSNKKLIKKNLPIAFRHHYNNVTNIIDCFEIEIEKPTKSVHQALTWSEYKKTNTIKYLISSTPDGLINYISPGYGGRISDTLLVEKSAFLETLSPGSMILADKGFKNIENLFSQKQCHLLRPPSISYGTKFSKQDARKSKEIASLRIHIERVIRRLREFSMLQPHSVVNHNLIRVLDECVVIACALVNLQDSIIK